MADHMHRREGCILGPDGWIRGHIEFGRKITRISGLPVPAPRAEDQIIVPGFIDLHVHGGAGADVMQGGAALDTITASHARHGTTALLATTLSAPHADLVQALHGVRSSMDSTRRGAARVLGVHLEGPYLNDGKLGAQPPFSRPASLAELSELHAIAPIRVLTLAPEQAGHLDFIAHLRQKGIITQCGHSAGSYEDAVAAMDAGARGFTHLFNAMSGLHHREPGLVGAALAHAEYAEIIPDLLHVHPGAIRAALRAIPRLYCVTDSTAAAGMPDGDYQLGSHEVRKCMGGVRLADGTLAGSALTMDQALRNLVHIGLDLDDAVRRLSTYPANYLGLADRGRVAEGAWADLAVFDHALQLTMVYTEGEQIDLAHA